MRSPSTTDSLQREMDTPPLRISPLKFVLDLILLGCVSIPILLFFLFGRPFQRGFFCNDESLLHPYHESTVHSAYLYIVGILIPCIVMSSMELIKVWHTASKRVVTFGGYSIPIWLMNAYTVLLPFLFGAASSQLTTDILKYTVGRLRPHFLTRCIPDIDCSLAKNQHVWHTNFECTNLKVNIKEMRLSFPSGHSSISMYTMLFFAIYIQQRWPWSRGNLIRHAIQFVAISASLFTAATRISDNKHHPEDVAAGLLIGAITAILVVRYVSNLLQKSVSISKASLHEETQLNAGNTNGRGEFPQAV